jgi:hypothetical protein
VSTSTKAFTVLAAVLLMTGAWTQHRAQTDRSIVLSVPVALQTGATISQTFTVDRATSYYLEIACERTHEAAEAGNDLDDALEDGLEADASITSDGRPITGVDCSDPGHYVVGLGFYSRVLCTFKARPGQTYNLALHIIRYGQGLSSRDHKLAGTWDENLTIPAEAHPRLKIEVDPLDYKAVAGWTLLSFVIGFICLISPLTFWISKIFRRTTPSHLTNR